MPGERGTQFRQPINVGRVAACHRLYHLGGWRSMFVKTTSGLTRFAPWFEERPAASREDDVRLTERERDVLRVLWRAMPSTKRQLWDRAVEAEFLAGRSRETAMRAWDRAVARLDAGARARLRARRHHLARGVGHPVDWLAATRLALRQQAGLAPSEIAELLQLCGYYVEAKTETAAGSDRSRTSKSIERARKRNGEVIAPVTPIRRSHKAGAITDSLPAPVSATSRPRAA